MNIAPLVPPAFRWVRPEWKRKPQPDRFDIRSDLLAASLRERRTYLSRHRASIGLNAWRF